MALKASKVSPAKVIFFIRYRFLLEVGKITGTVWRGFTQIEMGTILVSISCEMGRESARKPRQRLSSVLLFARITSLMPAAY